MLIFRVWDIGDSDRCHGFGGERQGGAGLWTRKQMYTAGHNGCADIYVLSRNKQGPKPTLLTVRSVISLMAGGVEGRGWRVARVEEGDRH